MTWQAKTQCFLTAIARSDFSAVSQKCKHLKSIKKILYFNTLYILPGTQNIFKANQLKIKIRKKQPSCMQMALVNKRYCGFA